jgi:quercetin dioxygenase-like cupin family protein
MDVSRARKEIRLPPKTGVPLSISGSLTIPIVFRLGPHTKECPIPSGRFIIRASYEATPESHLQALIERDRQAAARNPTTTETPNMISKHRILGITAILCGASLTPLLAQSGSPAVATGQREILLQTTQSWNGKPYTHYPTGQPQLTTLMVTIAPHTALPWHTHPFPNSVYVLSGTLTLHDRDSGKTLVVHQGQAVGESVDDVHRGESGDEPTVLLITYAGTPGVPTSVPAKGEKAEY